LRTKVLPGLDGIEFFDPRAFHRSMALDNVLLGGILIAALLIILAVTRLLDKSVRKGRQFDE
jgi:hypothetical protein